MASKQLLTIEKVNTLSTEDFQLLFNNVVELCPEACQEIEQKRPFTTINQFKKSFFDYIDSLDCTGKEKILKKHPRLIGKTYEKLTGESQNEQKFIGLSTINYENKRILEKLNQQYESLFSFPFVICARENTIESIITAIEKRLSNNPTEELHNAIEEVKKICSLRLNDHLGSLDSMIGQNKLKVED